MNKALGKIKDVRFGLGGYQDIMFGLTLTLETTEGSVQHFEGMWSPHHMERSEHAKWSEGDRSRQFDELVRNVDTYMGQAKVRDVSQLKNIPVEVTFDGMALKEWRILTEVL